MDGIKASQLSKAEKKLLSYLSLVSTAFSQLKETENSEVTDAL